jgi:nitric oxide reductase
VPFKDLEYLTQCAAIRSSGSATASEASNANKFVIAFPPYASSKSSFLILMNRELLNYIGNLVEQRMAQPKNDLISKLVIEQVRCIL